MAERQLRAMLTCGDLNHRTDRLSASLFTGDGEEHQGDGERSEGVEPNRRATLEYQVNTNEGPDALYVGGQVGIGIDL